MSPRASVAAAIGSLPDSSTISLCFSALRWSSVRISLRAKDRLVLYGKDAIF